MENPFEIIMEKLESIEQMLLELKIGQAPGNKDNQIELMTIKKVAEYLTLSVPTIYGMVHQSKIPNYKHGKRLYFKKSDIDEWITSGRRKTYAEIEKEALNYLAKSGRNTR